MNRPRLSLAIMSFLIFLLTPSSSWAQKGDRQGEVQKENWRQWNIPEAPVLSPSEALQAFEIAPGFRIELVACEPEIVDPVAMAWDEKGRLWVVELRGYMRTVDGDGEMDPVGQVVVLEDKDDDGVFEKSTVFLDGLINPRAIAIVEGGVLIGEPPHLWYCQDLDMDLKCDRRSEVTHYGTDNPDHVEHTDNGLIHFLDNWIYNAKSSRRFKFDVVEGKPQLKESNTAFRGQWGLVQDDLGRKYYNYNSTWIHADPLPADLLLRNPHCGKVIGQPARSGHRVIPDESTYPIRINSGINRGYHSHMLHADGRLKRNTAASGIAILRSQTWGEEWNGTAFVPEAAGNLVAAFRFKENGTRLLGEQLTWPHSKFIQQAFLASRDERFRPVDAKLGPDGNLYIIDMYRGIIQHRQFVTSYLRKQIEERKLATPIGLGRIWRVVKDSDQIFSQTPFKKLFATPKDQVQSLAHSVGWVRDTGQRLLVESGTKKIAPDLKKLLRDSSTGLGRLHAIWTLQGLSALDVQDHLVALSSDDEYLRRASCQILTTDPLKEEQDIQLIVSHLKKTSATPETIVGIVHRVLALSAFPENDVATEALFSMLREHGRNIDVRMAAISGWDDYQVERISRLIRSDVNIQGFSGLGKLLRELTLSALQKDSLALGLLLDMLDSLDSADPRLAAILSGINIAITDKRWKWHALPRTPSILQRKDLVGTTLGEAQAILARMEVDPQLQISVKEWTEIERRLARKGAMAFASSCASCHGSSGSGLSGLGPSLIDSPWLLDEAQVPVRIVLDGLTGPIEVDGETWDLTMPGHRENPRLADEDIAGLLTWARRQWGHQADPISPQQVLTIREATRGRKLPWTIQSLQKGPF